MSVQTSYDLAIAIAYAGLIYAQAPSDVISRSVEGAAGIGFGVAVSRGTDADKQALIGGATDFLGISIRDLSQESSANDGSIKWDETETMGILRDGYIWAVCPSGCVPGDVVNYVDATGVLDSGAPVADETGLDGAQWETTTAAGELGVIRLNSTDTTAGA